MNQAKAWDDTYNQVHWVNTPSVEFLAFMAEHYWGVKDATFLDLGSGTGASALFIANKGFRVIAVDASEVACELLCANLNKNTRNLVTVINRSVFDFKTEEKVDCIVMANLIDCLEIDKAKELLSTVRGWLKSNGRIYARILADKIPKEFIRSDTFIRPYNRLELHQVFGDHIGSLRLETRYLSDKWHPISNWVLSTTLYND